MAGISQWDNWWTVKSLAELKEAEMILPKGRGRLEAAMHMTSNLRRGMALRCRRSVPM